MPLPSHVHIIPPGGSLNAIQANSEWTKLGTWNLPLGPGLHRPAAPHSRGGPAGGTANRTGAMERGGPLLLWAGLLGHWSVSDSSRSVQRYWVRTRLRLRLGKGRTDPRQVVAKPRRTVDLHLSCAAQPPTVATRCVRRSITFSRTRFRTAPASFVCGSVRAPDAPGPRPSRWGGGWRGGQPAW